MYKKLKIAIPAFLFLLFSVVQFFEWIPALHNVIHDHIMVSTRAPAPEIILVGIDERTINEIGLWPHPRLYVAEAIARLTENGAAAIGVNIFYDTYGAFPEYDRALIIAAQQAGDRLVLGGAGVISYFQDDQRLLVLDDYIYPFGELGAAANVGFMNMIPDEADGVMRRALTSMRFGDITVHSLPFEVYQAFRRSMEQEPLYDVPLDAYGQFPIRFVGGPQTFTSFSLWGVINEHYPAARFRNAIVLIGPYTWGIEERSFTTPVERGTITHGIEIYANIIQNLLEGEIVTDAPWWVNLAIMAFSALVVILLFFWVKPVAAFFITVAMVAGVLFGARVAYDSLLLLTRVGDVVIFLGICYAANLTLGILSTQDEKQHIHGLFGRFVAPEVVKEIISGGLEVNLGGVVKEITALFVDVRGFTAFSESNAPEKVVAMINRYLALTSRSIQQNSGTIDKFIGDATMALFNAPNDVPDHALCAVKAAWAMKLGSAEVQTEIMREYGVDLQFGIGINTGTAVVGNMGSEFRMDYTAIGDTINTAARLEANAAKGQIIISEATYQQVKNFFDVEDLGIINVKNKAVGIQIYNVTGIKK